jgi:imidazoleglycerol-phosphate dehydratase
MVQIEKIRELKRKYGYTDKKLAEAIGYERPYINSIINGNKPLTPAFSARIIEAFPELAGGTERDRTGRVDRKTGETDISLELNIDGTGEFDINTGIYMLDHFLSQVARHGRFDLKLSAYGDDPHHLAEDVAICLGKALTDALGEKEGIVRMADAAVPMDDALAMVALDLSGRAYTALELEFNDNDMSGFSTDLIRHFLESFAVEARMNLHAWINYGTNDHHRAEALFKALGRALDMATMIDERIAGKTPSTKGMLEGGN